MVKYIYKIVTMQIFHGKSEEKQQNTGGNYLLHISVYGYFPSLSRRMSGRARYFGCLPCMAGIIEGSGLWKRDILNINDYRYVNGFIKFMIGTRRVISGKVISGVKVIL